MKISRLAIADYQQFKWLDLDLTYREGHPKAGQPLDKVCFIGANGTGKTTLLEILNSSFVSSERLSRNPKSVICTRFDNVYDTSIDYLLTFRYKYYIDSKYVDKLINESGRLYLGSTYKFEEEPFEEISKDNHVKILDYYEQNRFNTYIPTESIENEFLKIENLPKVNLDEALNLKKDFPKTHIISHDNFKEFWKLLIYHTNKRMSDEVEYLNENENEVVGKLKKQFAKNNPDILEIIAKLWAKILDRAGLYFDYEKAKRPFQLLDNLEAYIKLKSNDEVIPLNKLSSGIRDMIFRFGYLKALYFGRDIDWATALIDEPENSLFVDLQYNIIELYEEVCPNTQLFFATHSPIIAAQFHPDERVILEFDDEGYVTASRGVAAEGDDPNDVLIGDFKRESVLGKVGEEKWERYVQLIHLMENEKDEKKKIEHAKEFMKIGSDYKFGAVMPD